MDTVNDLEDDLFSPKPRTTPRKPPPRKRHVQSSIGPGELTPPSSGSQSEREPPRMLMSPPPEEALRKRTSTSPQKQRTPAKALRTPQGPAAKRKRVLSVLPIPETQLSSATGPATQPNFASSSRITIDATPNPKPRKQTKRHVAFTAEPKTPTASPAKSSRVRASDSPTKASSLRSPHASNVKADYIPPLHDRTRQSLARQRSLPPSPRYEPPSERFTPPREVLCTPVPSVSKSSKRKSVPWSRTKLESGKSKTKERRLTIQIKKEPPEIDLTEPLPPASPTDDPLLLYGPPKREKKKAMRTSLGLVSTYARDTPPISSSSPGLGPVDDGTMLMDVNMTGMDLTMASSDAPGATNDEDTLPAMFDFHDGADMSSEDTPEPEQGVSEAGYKTVSVPTKADPPSSVTRERQDRWGRPVSPFPYEARQDLEGEAEADEVMVDALLSSPRLGAVEEEDVLPPPTSESPRPSSPMPVRVPNAIEEVPVFRSSLSPVSRTPVISTPTPIPTPPLDDADNGTPRSDLDLETPERPRYEEYSRRLSQGHETIIEFEVPLPDEEDEDNQDEFGDTRPMTFFLPEELRNPPHKVDVNDGPLTNESRSAAREMPPAEEDDFEEMYADPNPIKLITSSESQQEPVEKENEEDEDEEDAASVVRELSQEPDADIVHPPADTWRRRAAQSKALQSQVTTSPHNPFHVRSPATAASLTNRRASLGLDVQNTWEEDDDDDSDLAALDLGVVKVTSEDPVAAARAAAILRLHKYDCIDVPTSLKKQASLRETILRTARRKSVLKSGVSKVGTRRRTSDWNKKVDLTELLREAEDTLIMEDDGPIMDLSPIRPAQTLAHNEIVAGPREWTKTDWKRLDGCYTDERVARGPGGGVLAPVDSVRVEDVVERFVEMVGGEVAVERLGSAWTRSNLAKRVRALSRKQASRTTAPPGHSLAPYSKYTETETPSQNYNYSVLLSPDVTLYEDLLPPSLLASARTRRQSRGVNYSSLMDDALAVETPATSYRPSRTPAAPPSLASKMKSLIASYLPKSSKPKPPTTRTDLDPKAPGLPVPPPELFQRPRPLVSTPAPKPPAPKPPHPKELVRLQPVMQRSKSSASMSQRWDEAVSLSSKGQALVGVEVSFARNRRDSGASVRDLVRTYESIGEKEAREKEGERVLELRRRKSLNLREAKEKPAWRP